MGRLNTDDIYRYTVESKEPGWHYTSMAYDMIQSKKEILKKIEKKSA